MEALKINDEYKIFTDNGRSPSNLNLYDWVKKITSSFDIDRLIYVSSPAVYLNNHYVGINKIRIERFLLKNKELIFFCSYELLYLSKYIVSSY